MLNEAMNVLPLIGVDIVKSDFLDFIEVAHESTPYDGTVH